MGDHSTTLIRAAKKSIARLTFSLLLFGAVSTSHAQIFVNASVAGGNDDGSSWANAYSSLQDALADACANAPTQIWVAQGTYYPDEGAGQTDDDRDASFELCEGVSIYGGFTSGDATLGDRNPNPNSNGTVLSGDLKQDDAGSIPLGDLMSAASRSDNAYSVVTVDNTVSNAELNGFTITGGNANATSGSSNNPNRSGGGIHNNGGSFTLVRCILSNNSANTGGGMLNRGSASPVVRGGRITDNFASSGGGGIANLSGSSPTLVRVQIIRNLANGFGGGLYCFNSDTDMANCGIGGNEAGFDGGGVYNFGSSPTWANCVVRGNAASNGAGIYNLGGGSPSLLNCTINGNVASSLGGGMYNLGGSDPELVNCIIWNNESDGSTVSLDASVVNFSAAPSFSFSLVANSGGSDSWDADTGTDNGNNIDADPAFVSPVVLGNVPTIAGDSELGPTSAAINMGNNAVVTTPPFLQSMAMTIDYNGDERIFDSFVDIGAYEYQVPLAINLTGLIIWEHDRVGNPQPIEGVTVALSGDAVASDDTDANGMFSFPGLSVGTYTLTPTKNDMPYQGVNSDDVTRIQQHITFIDRLDDGYKVIAADVNLSNSVSGVDAAIVFHAINSNPAAQTIFETPAWRFVDAEHTFADENAPWGFPEAITIEIRNGQTLDNTNFIGVKMGNVNGTWVIIP